MNREEINKWVRTTDEYALEKEWLTFSGVHQDICDHLVKAKTSYEYLKIELEELESRLNIEILTEPGKFGLKKATEGVRKAAVICQPEYIKMRQRVVDGMMETRDWENLLKSADAKRRCLENSVTLYQMSYYSEPSNKSTERIKSTNFRSPKTEFKKPMEEATPGSVNKKIRKRLKVK